MTYIFSLMLHICLILILFTPFSGQYFAKGHNNFLVGVKFYKRKKAKSLSGSLKKNKNLKKHQREKNNLNKKRIVKNNITKNKKTAHHKERKIKKAVKKLATNNNNSDTVETPDKSDIIRKGAKNHKARPGKDSVKALDSGFGNSRTIVRKKPVVLNANRLKIPYPKRAKSLRVEGTVRLLLTISKEGKVKNAKIISGPRFGLRRCALRIAKKLLFLPATDLNGFAKGATIDHEVVFKLNTG